MFCVSETHTQDPTFLITLRGPSKTFSRFTLGMSGDPVSSARGHSGIGIALSTRFDRGLLDTIPAKSCLCAIHLNGSVRVSSSGLRHRCPFTVCIYTLLEPKTSSIIQFCSEHRLLLANTNFPIKHDIVVIIIILCQKAGQTSMTAAFPTVLYATRGGVNKQGGQRWSGPTPVGKEKMP